jgi:hypothetical protein
MVATPLGNKKLRQTAQCPCVSYSVIYNDDKINWKLEHIPGELKKEEQYPNIFVVWLATLLMPSHTVAQVWQWQAASVVQL